MATIKERLTIIKNEFDTLRKDKESLLTMIDEADVPGIVYNSNAIENSTLTLKETEKILLGLNVSLILKGKRLLLWPNILNYTTYRLRL